MIHYLFTSALLLLIGWLVYLMVVRRRASLRERKGFIYLAILSSLLLPLRVAPLPEPQLVPDGTARIAPLAFGHINEQHLQQYCKCQQPNYSHRIQYRANAFYNFVVAKKRWINRAFGLMVGVVLLFLGLQLHFLWRIRRQSRVEERSLNGKRYRLLYPPQKLGAGAFQLRHRYVIWQEEMRALSEAEREAIFRHELSHLAQYNTLEKAVLRLLLCLWFFHPVFYYFRRELELLSECLADQAGAQALPHPKQYASLLLKLKSQQFASMMQFFGGSVLKTRIETLLHQPRPLRGLAVLAVAGLGSLQLYLVQPLSAQVAERLYALRTYEEIYYKVPPQTEQAVYCTDCNTVCHE